VAKITIDTDVLRSLFDAIDAKIKRINRLTSKDPKANFYPATVAFSELDDLYRDLGKSVFHAYIKEEHKQAIADIESQLQLPGHLTQKTSGDT
jgi:hypothetical protein